MRGWRGRAWARATVLTAFVMGLVTTGLVLWRGTIPVTPVLTGSLLTVALATLALAPLAGVVAACAIPGRRRPRRALTERLASVTSLAAFTHLAAWIVRTDALDGIGAGLVAACAGVLYAEGLRRLVRGRLDAGLLAERRAAGVAGVAGAAILVLAGAVLVPFLAWGIAAGGPRLVDTAPAKRVVLVEIDGVARDHFAYWMALRRGSALEALATNGASAQVAWPVLPSPGAALSRLGTVTPVAVPARARIFELATLRAIVRSAWLLPARTSPAPATLWGLAERLGVGALVAGWEREDLGSRQPGRVITPGDHARLVALLSGDVGALDALPDAAFLREMRELARPPLDDWRHGARLSEAEARAARAAAEMGVDAEGYWADRFLLRAFLQVLDEGDRRFAALRLGFGRTLTAAADATAPDGARALRDATVAYLDALDDELTGLRRSLRAGDALAVLVTSSEAGAALRPAPLVLFGEKAARGASVPELVSVDDLGATLRYLLGIRLPGGAEGEVAWDLLVPGLAERLPPDGRP